MFQDQILISVSAFAVTLGAAVGVTISRSHLMSARYLLTAVCGSLGVALGIFVTVFVVGGFGWGWSSLGRTKELLLLAIAGLCAGLLYAGFGWLVSRRFLPSFTAGILSVNVALAFTAADDGVWRWGRFAVFVLANFLLLYIWIGNTAPRRVGH